MDYVQQIQAELSRREEADQRIKRQGSKRADLQSLTPLELILFLELNGAKTIGRLSRELNVEVQVVKAYVKALEKDGRVLTKLSSNRKKTIVCLNESQ